MRKRLLNRPMIVIAIIMLLLTGCSVRRAAVNLIGDAVSGNASVYSSDDDPELIRAALPFGLKMFESLLEVSPQHEGLLLAASQGFTGYAFLLQNEADRFDAINPDRARDLRARVSNLYLRGRKYALKGLDTRHPGFISELRSDRAAAVAKTTAADVPWLYWAGASWAGAISATRDDLDLIIELPFPSALMERVLQLNESYDLGAAHEFFITYETSRPGGSTQLAREHYQHALRLSGGQRASVHVALAETVAVREQNLSEFRTLLFAALAVQADENPQLRLTNTVAKQRAIWLQSRIRDLFIEAEP